MSELEWRLFDIESCPFCGCDIEVLTPKKTHEDYWIDSSEARCCNCDYRSAITADYDGVYLQED